MGYGLFCQRLAEACERLGDMPVERRHAASSTCMRLAGEHSLRDLLGGGAAAQTLGADALECIGASFSLLAEEMRSEEEAVSK